MERQLAIVSGGSGGMAPGLIAPLLDANFRVVITGRRPSELDEAAEKFETAGATEVIAIPADVTDPQSTSALVAEILSRFGRGERAGQCRGK
jgi:NAD(P)-dependent dehydrogenase (short-subunit alcohol dehydrogenase family)